ncbi:MAG: hypothetical protein P1V51_18195 [Deltaproteobacteria bacterium]|nr:hypothetical protein [Deltaproteobacteria bacterium]
MIPSSPSQSGSYPAVHASSDIPGRWIDRTSPYFVHRMVILGSWLALSLVCVLWATSGGEENDLSARVMVVDTGFGIAVSVQNESDEVWTNVQLQLEPGGWIYRKPAFRPNERFSVQVQKFEAVGPQGPRHPEQNFKPKLVRVVTEEATYQKPF